MDLCPVWTGSGRFSIPEAGPPQSAESDKIGSVESARSLLQAVFLATSPLCYLSAAFLAYRVSGILHFVVVDVVHCWGSVVVLLFVGVALLTINRMKLRLYCLLIAILVCLLCVSAQVNDEDELVEQHLAAEHTHTVLGVGENEHSVIGVAEHTEAGSGTKEYVFILPYNTL